MAKVGPRRRKVGTERRQVGKKAQGGEGLCGCPTWLPNLVARLLPNLVARLLSVLLSVWSSV